ncbi:MAG: hypothetical protein H6557_33655 [Lewinellaceae bacterium]|nr:hypothetical protein [Phaeodactylibacter sp.]MCB9041586.1 hypothetical protein [Lewinellaceae bacterium]
MIKSKKIRFKDFIFKLLIIGLLFTNCDRPLENGSISKEFNTQEEIENKVVELGNLLEDFQVGKLDTSKFVSRFGKELYNLHSNSNIPVYADLFPGELKNLSEDLLIAIINSNGLNEKEKVSVLLLQDHSSSKVREIANEAGLLKNAVADEASVDTITIGKNGYKVETNILSFESEDSFSEFMKTLVNQDEEKINDWEKSINFTSMRRNFENIKQKQDIDHLKIDTSRIPDIWFESVVNPDGKLRIANTIYEFDFAVDEVKIRDEEADCYVTMGIGNRIGGDCSNKIEVCTRDIPVTVGSSITLGRKWDRWYLVYASVGARTTIYLDPFNQAPRTWSVNSVNLLIDQWHRVDIGICNWWGWPGLPIISISNIGQTNNNTWQANKVWVWSAGSSVPKFNVPVYQRVHHWYNGNWNQDCHTDNW